ncbi:MAG: Nramp family divalent metal transporter, partial [Desulfurococcus sp.]|uniref:Nramp family divalent metal transporter n=1 Tax=Desulfurococcus sp. TaxID=51678 RepID=UPI003D134FB1
GVVIALTWWGAGDVVDSTAAGASYGYALMWTMTLAVLIRSVVTYLIGKYTIVTGETIIEGFKRISRILLYLLLIATIYYLHMYGAFLLKASAAGIWEIAERAGGDIGLFVIALVLSILSLIIFYRVMGREWYKYIEYIFKALAAIAGAVLVAILVFNTLRNPLAIPMMLINAINFLYLPPGVGPWEASFLAVGAIGAIGGSITNLFYSYFVREKGWRGSEGVRSAIYDITFALIFLLILNLALWTLGAEILRPQGIHVTSIADIAYGTGYVFGSFGYYIMLLGFFVAAYTSYIGCAIGLSLLGVNIIHVLKPERRNIYTELTKDPIFTVLLIFGLVPPVIWSLPGMPGVVWLIIFGNATNVFAVPIIAIGVFILVTSKRYIG